MFFVYKYVTGNGFWQASPSVGGIKPKELWNGAIPIGSCQVIRS